MAPHYTDAILPGTTSHPSGIPTGIMPHANVDRDQLLATWLRSARASRPTSQDFTTRMDQDYFAAFPPKLLASHVTLAALLTPDHPCEIRFTKLDRTRWTITIVGTILEFATICGLLSAFGLNIEEGLFYLRGKRTGMVRSLEHTVWHTSQAAGTARTHEKKIVDVFTVTLTEGRSVHRRRPEAAGRTAHA